MLGALVSTLTGVLGGGIPTALKIFREYRDHKSEMERLAQQQAFQLQVGATRLEEASIQAHSDAHIAAFKHDTALGKGASQWVVDVRALSRVFLSAFLLSTTSFAVIWSFVHAQELEGVVNLVIITEFLMAATNTMLSFWFTDRALGKMVGGQQ